MLKGQGVYMMQHHFFKGLLLSLFITSIRGSQEDPGKYREASVIVYRLTPRVASQHPRFIQQSSEPFSPFRDNVPFDSFVSNWNWKLFPIESISFRKILAFQARLEGNWRKQGRVSIECPGISILPKEQQAYHDGECFSKNIDRLLENIDELRELKLIK